MGFWGVEVKPGRPITHSCEEATGRLRISQATLALGEASNKTVVQCNVGERRPVLLCALLPDKTESCHLDLEFEEEDDVVFSVIGPRSVFLTGYYKSGSQNDTIETNGLDIQNSAGNDSNYNSEEDRYGGSFINNDEDLEVFPESPLSGGRGMDDAALDDVALDDDEDEDDQPEERVRRGRRLRKRYRVIESDNDVSLHEDEDEYEDQDEDGSLVESKEVSKTIMSDAGEKIAQIVVETNDDGEDEGLCGAESKQEVDPLEVNCKVQMETTPPLDGEKAEVKNGRDEVLKEVGTLEKFIVSEQDIVHGNNTEDTIINQSLPVSNEKDQPKSLDVAKSKRKRKDICPKDEDKTSKIRTDNRRKAVIREDEEHDVEVSSNLGIGENCLVNLPELSPVDGQKSEKRKNELQLEGALTDGINEVQNVSKENTCDHGLLNLESLKNDLPASNIECEKHRMLEETSVEGTGTERLEETSMEGMGTECHNIPREDEVMGEPHADSTTEDLLAANGEKQEPQKDLLASNGESKEQKIESNVSPKSELPAEENQAGKKIKKVKTRSKKITDNKRKPKKSEDQSTEAVRSKRTLANGLIVEDLESGPPDGKVAVPGKKVKIYYTGMLKENMNVFDSNVGRVVFRFCLGDEEFIDGWNVGIEGMRVGGKRRLIIPPSMGFGDQGVEGQVPPNSWVVYDIELVGVRK